MPVYSGFKVETDEDRLKQQELEFLDTLDLEGYLSNKDWSVLKMMDEIQEDHGEKYTKESYIFNAIDMQDFMEYIRRRYKDKYKFYMYSEIRARIEEA